MGSHGRYVDHHSTSTVAGLFILFLFFYNRDVKQILFLAMPFMILLLIVIIIIL
jgi:hypothetical protein